MDTCVSHGQALNGHRSDLGPMRNSERRSDPPTTGLQQGGRHGDSGTLGVQDRVKDDRQRFTARSGVAVLGTKKPVPLNGTFRAGSITKTFVSTVVLQLVGEGRVELDEPVER